MPSYDLNDFVQSDSKVETYDPSNYTVTLYWIGEDGKTHPYKVFGFSDDMISAKYDSTVVVRHKGVGGEVYRTFPSAGGGDSKGGSGVVTLSLFSNSIIAEILSNLFSKQYLQGRINVEDRQVTSPVTRITVSSESTTSTMVSGDGTPILEKGKQLFINADNCWLTEIPELIISKEPSAVKFVFECDTLFYTHGISKTSETKGDVKVKLRDGKGRPSVFYDIF